MALDLKERLARQASGGSHLEFDPTGRDEPQLLVLPLKAIDRDPSQPRVDIGDLAGLAMSIRDFGLVNPIVVEAVADGRYRILAGERRFAACERLGMESLPCIVRTVAEHSRLALQLIENLHRKDLHPVEEARAFRRLMDEFNLDQRELAARLGKAPSTVSETLRILDIDPPLLDSVRTSEHATKSVLLEIAKEFDPARQQELWQRVQESHQGVRQIRLAKRAGSSVHRRGAVFSVEVEGATIVVRFQSGEATTERILTALRQAGEVTSSRN